MTTQAPLVSVVINNYNYGSFLMQAIESALNQTCPPLEVIVVDDGSTDVSRALLQGLKDNKVKVILKENGGQASAFNAGFQASQGELIAFLDSDDWWMPNKLEEVLRWHAFLKGDYALLQHNVLIFDEGDTYPAKQVMYSGNFFAHTIRTGELAYFLGSSSLVVPRDILAKIMPIPLSFRISADAYLTRTVYTYGNAYSIPTPLSYYRKHGGNAVLEKNVDHNKFHRETLFSCLNKFNDKRGIDYRYKTRDQICDADLHPSDFLMRFLLKKKFSEIVAKYNRVAFFGGGLHSRWFSKILNGYKNEHIVAVLDIDPPKEIFFDQPVIEARKWDASNADAIILSTNSMQDVLTERCRALYGNSIPLIDLYTDDLHW
ncbi:MAG: hypothetical protein A2Y14_02635 [Verrucomicrobia bacterium GWF2_51_19]|nr:MAG: hypothetical protein A2Y14_02635 [Verrucomicrobia bacterium GWF2_51_19]HCJ11622.1 hypothetical protein [Opitutae bacterium]